MGLRLEADADETGDDVAVGGSGATTCDVKEQQVEPVERTLPVSAGMPTRGGQRTMLALIIERSVYGLETAFRVTAGHGGLHMVICAEYDALPGIGHACGHNIIAASSVGAGLALSELADDLGIRVTVLGTPAEERGGGKIDLINAGAFDNADLAMMVHPGPMEVVDLPTLAWASLEVTYHGKESHASMAPHRGLNALDAINISYVAIAALRQHIRQTERIHGIVTHGGDAPNIVPRLTRAAYVVRAACSEELQLLKERVVRCLEAGALATGCELEVRWLVKDYEFVRMNPTIGALYEANLEKIGRSAIPRQVVGSQAASTDMGNVSQLVRQLGEPFDTEGAIVGSQPPVGEGLREGDAARLTTFADVHVADRGVAPEQNGKALAHQRVKGMGDDYEVRRLVR